MVVALQLSRLTIPLLSSAVQSAITARRTSAEPQLMNHILPSP
jgi:hypothetical protein